MQRLSGEAVVKKLRQELAKASAQAAVAVQKKTV
jgi:hypothetical protein